MIDPEMIQSLREPGFAKRVWGYDRDQVDALLEELGERLERAEVEAGAPPATEVAELTGVGEKVETILAAAREAAEQARADALEKAATLKRESEGAAEQVRREAEEYSSQTRSAADEHDASTREEAEKEAAEIRENAAVDAEAKIAAAEEEAEQLLRDARLELGRIEDSIDDFRERRSLVIASIKEMRGRLSSMVGEATEGTGEFLIEADDDLSEEGTAILDAAPDASGNGHLESADEATEALVEVDEGETEEYDTGDWGAVGEDETIESEADEFTFADADTETDERSVRNDDL